MSTGRSQLAARHTPPPISWRCWPLADGGWRAAALSGVLVGGAAVVAWAMHSLVWGAMALLLLAAAMWRFFVPVVYELSALGVTQHIGRRQLRVAWSAVERCEICRDGIYLSSPGAPLEKLRGLYIPWGNHRDAVLALVHYYVPRVEERVEP